MKTASLPNPSIALVSQASNQTLHPTSNPASAQDSSPAYNSNSPVSGGKRTAPLAIMGAMTKEVRYLVAELTDARVVNHGNREYHCGNLWGREVVIVFSPWGKVSAAMTATSLITEFGVDSSEYGIPCAVVRTISDSASDAAGVDFLSFVQSIASFYSHGILCQFIALQHTGQEAASARLYSI